MIDLECKSKFKIFEPLEDYHQKCPWVLIICSGEHLHPIPIPSKTPPFIRNKIFDLLNDIEDDVADLTLRRLLRHPVIKTYLKQELPHISDPMLLDLHPSLANREHLRVYIDTVKKDLYPNGTGWEGTLLIHAHSLFLNKHP